MIKVPVGLVSGEAPLLGYGGVFSVFSRGIFSKQVHSGPVGSGASLL